VNVMYSPSLNPSHQGREVEKIHQKWAKMGTDLIKMWTNEKWGQI